jgi:hypothetical protein
MARIHQQNLKAAFLKHLKERDPIHARGFHHHGLHTTGSQPIRKPVEIGGKGAELTHRLGVTTGRDSDKMSSGADIDTGSMQVDVL